MTIQQNTDRIQTTHIGSLPRPHDLLDIMKAKYNGQPYDQRSFDEKVTKAVADVVKKQADCGIDIVTDGEFSKPGFFTYIRERLEGFESRPNQKFKLFEKEVAAFPEYYAQYFKEAMLGGTVVPLVPVVCTGPVKYKGESYLQKDIANVKAAAKAAGVPDHHVFLPATAPSGVGINEYYKSDEDYFHALAGALAKEYRAIVDAGFLLQIDDPDLPDGWQMFPEMSVADYRKYAQLRVDALNHALKGLPEDRVRLHVCWGSGHGPHKHDIPLKDIVDIIFDVRAECVSIEASNPRHEHEWTVFEDYKLPAGRSFMPGVIGHATDLIEHPQLIAQRLVRYAGLMGRENVIAGADCGLGSRVGHPEIAWAKLEAQVEGCRLATQQLWK